MRLYLEVAKKSFQRQITYRSATIAGLLTNLFFGILRASVMIAVYGAAIRVAGYTLTDAITYTGVTQGLIAAVALWGWFDMLNSIKSGEVANDLSRPFDYYGFWLAQDMGRGLYQLVARGVSMVLAFSLLFHITLPDTLGQWWLTLISIGLGMLLSFAWRFMVSAAAFWVMDAVGFARMAYFLVLFPSGFLIPLDFMPDWLQRVCNATPFPGIINTPLTIYLGHARGVDALALILSQLAWAAVLIALGRLVLEAGRRKLTIQGG